jgi:sugar lactone lactonase YvrE
VLRARATSTRRACLTLVSVLVLFTATAGAQSRRSQRAADLAPRPVYPNNIIPVDAIRGHLMNGWFKEPVDVFFDVNSQEVVVADSKNGLIGIFDTEGVPVFAFGGASVMTDPRRVVTTADGSIYVLDSEQGEIKAFSYRGEILPPLRFAYPATEEETGGVARINAFHRDAQGNWYIGDMERPQLLVYDKDLVFKFAIRPEPAGREV